MLPNCAAAWYIPAAGLFCALWWWWPKGMGAAATAAAAVYRRDWREVAAARGRGRED